MKKAVIIVAGLAIAGPAFAQDETDALRYSTVDMTGTARLSALGGAFGALGGDISALSVNPAGIGVFNKSMFSITPSLYFNATDTDLRGRTAGDVRSNFNLGNIGFVLNINRKKHQDVRWAWKSFQFGIGYNRMNTYQSQAMASAVSTGTSYIDHMVGQANGTKYSDLDPFGAGLGWETYLFDQTDSTSNNYVRNLMPNYGQEQRISEYSRGSMGEVAVSMGGNFGNTLYIGATFGIPKIDYQVKRELTETDKADTIANFTSFTRTDYVNAKGTGFNFKLGLIYRPLKWLRLGAAVHTPTIIDMSEMYSADMVAQVYDTTYSFSSPEGSFNYSVTTPFRAIGSLAFVVKDYGLFTADYEYVNYAMARMRSDSYSFSIENAAVQNRLSWVGNIRIGTEWRIDKFSLRGGFALLGNPYTGSYDFSDTRYSLGAGLMLKHFFFDLTYMLQRKTGSILLYGTEGAAAESMAHSILFTAGVRF